MSAGRYQKENAASRENLYPTTPLSTKRYDQRSTPIELPCEADLPAATHLSTSFPAPAYLASRGWQTYTHPEGKPYYVYGLSPRIVTEADINDAETLKLIDSYTELVLGWAAEQQIQLVVSVELFLEPEVETGLCDYYLVDHDTRATFWLEKANTCKLGLPMTCSSNHLKLALEENYWKHVEMFSMHLDDLPGALEELTAIYLHGRADLSTSTTSTFYFSPQVTATHLQILKDCRDMSKNPITFTFIGRLWGYIVNARFQNLYGDTCSRLDRTTRIFEHEEEKPTFLSRCLSAVMFGLPEGTRAQLEEQYVDGLVIEKVWSGFLNHQISEWNTLMQWTFALIISNALAVPASPIPLLAHISLVLSTIALLMSVLLQQHFKGMSANVDAALTFLDGQNGKMMPLSIVLCMPRAAFLWALVLFTLQSSAILLCFVPLAVSIVSCIVLLAFALAARRILYPADRYARRQYTFFTLPQIPIFSFLRRGERIRDAELSI